MLLLLSGRPHWYFCLHLLPILRQRVYILGMGGAVAQSVERATPGEEILGSITAVAARSLLVGYNVNGGYRSHGLPALSRVRQHVKLSDVSLVTRPRYCLVVDEDVKKPTNQTNKKKAFLKVLCDLLASLWCGKVQFTNPSRNNFPGRKKNRYGITINMLSIWSCIFFLIHNYMNVEHLVLYFSFS